MKIFSAIKEVFKAYNDSDERRKAMAIKAAEKYMSINKTNKYKGKQIDIKRKEKLLRHFEKQFNAWKFG